MKRLTIVLMILQLVLSSLLALHGWHKKSLSNSGALAAFCVGFATLISGWWFASVLIGFYLLGSRITKARTPFLLFKKITNPPPDLTLFSINSGKQSSRRRLMGSTRKAGVGIIGK